jgi:hypothetical protein
MTEKTMHRVIDALVADVGKSAQKVVKPKRKKLRKKIAAALRKKPSRKKGSS